MTFPARSSEPVAITPSTYDVPARRREEQRVAWPLLPHLGQPEPGLDDRVGVEAHRLDALLEEPLGGVGVVRGALAADADVLVEVAAGRDRARQQLQHGGVALVEAVGDE